MHQAAKRCFSKEAELTDKMSTIFVCLFASLFLEAMLAVGVNMIFLCGVFQISECKTRKVCNDAPFHEEKSNVVL